MASGVITQADLLRIEVAVANAEQQALEAQSQGATARAQLFAAIGLPPAEAAELSGFLVNSKEAGQILGVERGVPANRGCGPPSPGR